MNIITSKDAKDAEFFYLSVSFFLNCGENFPGKKSQKVFLLFWKSHKILLQKMFMGNDICRKSTKMFFLSHFQSVRMVGSSTPG